MAKENFNIAVTVRMPESLFTEMKKYFGPGKPFRDQVDAARGLIGRGLQFEQYLKIAKDETATQEATEMLKRLEQLKMDSQYIETLSTKDFEVLKTIIKVEDAKRVKADLMQYLH